MWNYYAKCGEVYIVAGGGGGGWCMVGQDTGRLTMGRFCCSSCFCSVAPLIWTGNYAAK